MFSELFYAAAGAFVGALVALAVYHATVVRPALTQSRRLLEVHDNLISGGTGSAAGRLATLEEAGDAAARERQKLDERLASLEALSQSDLSRTGFVRYDAFAGAAPGSPMRSHCSIAKGTES